MGASELGAWPEAAWLPWGIVGVVVALGACALWLFVRRARHFADEVQARRDAEARLRRSEARYRSLIDATYSVLWVTDRHGHMLLEQAAFRAFSGQGPEESRGLGWLHSVHDEDRPRFVTEWTSGLAQRCSFDGEARFFSERHGSHRTCIVRAAPVRNDAGAVEEWVVSLHDVEDRKQAERERRDIERRVQESRRMESLGVLAGGVAHDFNNLLVGVMGHAEWVSRHLDDNSPLQENLHAIVATAERAAALCKQMLAFAGKGRFLVEPCQVSCIAKDMHSLLSSLAPRGTRLTLQTPSDLPPVQADPAELKQVLLSLVTNSAEALAERRSGHIEVTTGARFFTARELASTKLGAACQEGDYVYFEVRDDGPGIASEVLPRIFDPFFSTKFIGRGLSLAAVLGIARSHRGTIDVVSKLGEGTRVRVLLPALLSGVSAVRSPSLAAHSLTGTVLVIDDDEGVRELARLTLEDVGASVHVASTGEEALEIFRAHHQAIDLVLLDLTMPGMDSATTLRNLRGIASSVRVLLTSGYSAADARERIGEPSADGFLQKPWRPSELVTKLASVMVRRASERDDGLARVRGCL